jgi:hypothetical protein
MNGHEYRLRDHLLGRLPESDRDEADRKLITDRAYCEAISAEEQLLIEQYVSDELPVRERREFEEQVRLRPDLRELIVLERISRRPALAAVPVRAGTGWSRMLLPLAASIAVAAIGSAVYFRSEIARERGFLAAREHDWQSREAGQRARIAQLEAQARLSEAPPQENRSIRAGAPRPILPIVASFFVEPYTLGRSDEPRFAVPKSPGRVELQFSIGPENRFTEYRISILTASGSVVRRVRSKPRVVRDRFRVVSATVPSDLAKGQHFEASVAGIAPGRPDERLASYAFILAGQ